MPNPGYIIHRDTFEAGWGVTAVGRSGARGGRSDVTAGHLGRGLKPTFYFPCEATYKKRQNIIKLR